jgi:hypothetical protein
MWLHTPFIVIFQSAAEICFTTFLFQTKIPSVHIIKMVTNRAQGSVLLLEGYLIWGLDCHPPFNFVCMGEDGDPHTQKIMGTTSKTAVISCLAGGIEN